MVGAFENSGSSPSRKGLREETTRSKILGSGGDGVKKKKTTTEFIARVGRRRENSFVADVRVPFVVARTERISPVNYSIVARLLTFRRT